MSVDEIRVKLEELIIEKKAPIKVGANYCKKCAELGIKKRATYNIKGSKNGVCCKAHMSPDMMNVMDNECCENECRIKPYYAYPDDITGALYCKKHAKQGMVKIGIKKCKQEGCLLRPNFNYQGIKGGLYCKTHALPNMTDVTHSKCKFIGCNTQAAYNYNSLKKPLYCGSHALPDMINIRVSRCKYAGGCNKRANYNIDGSKTPLYCKTHASSDMKNIKKDKCKQKGCDTSPSFNLPGEKKALYCKLHAIPGMMDVKNPKCKFPGCNKFPSFNIDPNGSVMYCRTHASEDMTNVKNVKCLIIGCNSRPTYGFPLQDRSHCTAHRLEGMTRRTKQKCVNEECKDLAIYGFLYQTHCELHKSEFQINHVERKCDKCGLIMVLGPNNLCQYCGDFSFKKTHLIKQTDVKNFFDASGIRYTSYDKVYDRECGLERPDFIFDYSALGFVIIVEVDENQHKSYLETCECQRMVNIYNGYGGVSVMFIRYNPDKYVGEQHTDQQKKEYLKQWLIWVAHNPSKLPLTFVKLFFDGFAVSDTKLIEIPVI